MVILVGLRSRRHLSKAVAEQQYCVRKGVVPMRAPLMLPNRANHKSEDEVTCFSRDRLWARGTARAVNHEDAQWGLRLISLVLLTDRVRSKPPSSKQGRWASTQERAVQEAG
uniref:tRNA-specific adenosine deaminase 1 n=1 Tax=Steinernema glaseri TaxID=37863 RepID=A0A1I7Y0X8_9BILA